jgi:hypothetical protein
MKQNVRLISGKSHEVESFVEEYGTPFHSFTFLNMVGVDYKCIVCETEDNKIMAVLPLVYCTKYRLKAFHIPPYTYQFGPVIHPNFQKPFSEVFDMLIKVLPSAKHYDFKLKLDEQDLLAFIQNGFSTSVAQTHLIDRDVDYGKACLNGTKRRYLNKLFKYQKEGKLYIEENKQENLKFLLELQNETAERSRFNSREGVLEKIFNSGVKAYNNVVFDANGHPLSGAYCPYDKSTMYHLIGASVRVDDTTLNKSNILSVFSAVSHANSQNLDFDFEGSSIPGIANFYRMMGAKPKVVYRAQKTSSLYYQGLRFFEQVKREKGIKTGSSGV